MDNAKGFTDKIKFNMSLFWAVVLSFVTAGVVEILWLIKFGNTPEKYTVPILAELAGEFSNKSTENRLYWVAGIIGLVIIWGVYYLYNRHKSLQLINAWSDYVVVIAALGVYIFSQYFLWSKINPIIILLFATSVFAVAICKERVLECMALFLTYYYGIIGLYRLYVLLKSNTGFSLNSTFCVMITFVFTFITIYITRGNVVRNLLVSQLFVAFLPLIFLTYKYAYGEAVVDIKPEKPVYILIIGYIILAIIAICCKIKNHWNNSDDFKNCISVFTPIAIMAFNRFSGAGYIVTTDMHHPAENVIAYREVFHFGQKLFEDYIPISGLFSIVQGAFFELFGDGKYASYYLTEDIFYLAIAVLIVVAIRLHLNSVMTLIISAFIYIVDYNRVVLLLPFILILLAERLVRKPVYWFMVWILFGWAYGLYYPAYGIAIVIAMIPMGIYQLPNAINEIKSLGGKDKIKYAVLASLELILIIWSLPLLIGTAKHSIVMSDGMLYIEGVTTFGQAITDEFFSSLNTNDRLYTIRLVLGYVFRFTVPLFMVWIGSCSLFVLNKEDNFNLKNIFKMNEGKAIGLTLFLLPLVSFYFSLQRIGRGMFNKATFIIVYLAIVIMIAIYKRGKDVSEKYILILLCVFASAMTSNAGISNTDGKFFKAYTVPEDYVYVEENELYPNLGVGFIQTDQLKDIQDKAVKYSKLDKNKSYYMLYTTDMQADYGMALDLVLDIKGDAVLEAMTVMSDKATIETAESLMKNNTVVGNALTLPMHYNIYRWLMTSNQYIWDKNQSVFLPVEGQSSEEIRQCNANAVMRKQAGECEKFAAALGNSIEALEDNSLKEEQMKTSTEIVDNYLYINFDDTVDGNDVDYIYFDTDINQKITPYIMGDNHEANNKLEASLMKHGINKGLRACLEWKDDVGNPHTIYTDAENGKLLFPIGAGTGWLCNGHSYVKIWFEQDGNVTGIPEKYDVKFYHQKDLDF